MVTDLNIPGPLRRNSNLQLRPNLLQALHCPPMPTPLLHQWLQEDRMASDRLDRGVRHHGRRGVDVLLLPGRQGMGSLT